MAREHGPALAQAVRDGALWRLRSTIVPAPEAMATEIERLGAKLDGVLRRRQRASDGTLRDTCVHSIIAPDWPAVRANLHRHLREET